MRGNHLGLLLLPIAVTILLALPERASAQSAVMSFTCKDLKGQSFAHDGTTATSTTDGMDKISVKTTVFDDSSALIEFVPLAGANKARTRSSEAGTVLNAGIVANIPAHISVTWKETDLETWMVTYFPVFGVAAFTTHKLASDGKKPVVRVYQFFGDCTAASAGKTTGATGGTYKASPSTATRPTSATASDRGIVSSSVKDETFIVELSGGKAVFKARTYCFNVNEGDQVVFTKNPSVCTSNTFVNKRTGKTCDVWCE